MRVLLYGSLDTRDPNHATVEKNVAAFIDILIRKNAKFVCRSVAEQPDPEIIPIDALVLSRIANSNDRVHLTLFHEPGKKTEHDSGLRARDHTASSSERRAFYAELLGLVDVVVGVGGNRGLVRMEISCQLYNIPIFVLPGSGGAADILWSEMFTKSPQFLELDAHTQTVLKAMPYANSLSSNYGKRTFGTLEKFVERHPDRRAAPELQAIDLQSYGISDLVLRAKRLSIQSWGTIAGIQFSLLSVAYLLGDSEVGEHLRQVIIDWLNL